MKRITREDTLRNNVGFMSGIINKLFDYIEYIEKQRDGWKENYNKRFIEVGNLENQCINYRERIRDLEANQKDK